MKEKVLEIEIIKVNEDWSVWYITHQNEEVLPRGKFGDEELKVYSFDNPLFSEITNNLYILGRHKKEDLMPCVIKDSNIPLLKERINKINEKYGIKTENLGVDRDMLKFMLTALQKECKLLANDIYDLTHEAIKEELTRLKDMLEYILEAFKKAKKI